MEYKKFMESEMLIGAIATLFFDVLCIVIDFTGVGVFLVLMLKPMVLFGLDQWIKSHGGQSSADLKKLIGKFFLNELPFMTFILFLVSVFLHNHPSIGGIVTKATGGVGGGAKK